MHAVFDVYIRPACDPQLQPDLDIHQSISPGYSTNQSQFLHKAHRHSSLANMAKSITSVDHAPTTVTKESATDDSGYPPEVAALMQEFTGAKYNKLMRKLDMRLIPMVSVLPAYGSRASSGSHIRRIDCDLISLGLSRPV